MKSRQTTFFLDCCLGRHLVANTLRQAGYTVEVHHDHFPPDALDEEWLPVVGRNGWLALTKDEKISKRGIERRSVREHGVRLYALVGRRMTGGEMGDAFVRAAQRMLQAALDHRPPYIFKVYRDGKLQKLAMGRKV